MESRAGEGTRTQVHQLENWNTGKCRMHATPFLQNSTVDVLLTESFGDWSAEERPTTRIASESFRGRV